MGVALCLLLTLTVSACESGTPAVLPVRAGAGDATPATTSNTVTIKPAGAQVPLQRAFSRLRGALAVHRSPSAKSAVIAQLAAKTSFGSPRVLLVDRTVPGWVRVELPVRPNGSSGWVATRDVRLERATGSIIVDLSARRMTLRLAGQPVVKASVSIGTAKDPTPVGRFYVTDRLQPPNPNGVYGSFALGLSAHSDTLSEFGDGDGQIGVHGTNVPASIGKAASHGCIRVPANVAALLARVPLGTPVEIQT